MKKFFRLALVGILGLGLLSTSCRKKGDEPTPARKEDPNVNNNNNNGGGTNSGENNGGGTNTEIKPSSIVLKLKDGATEFSVEKVVGTELKITGANETTLAKGKITATPGATIQLEGKLDTLILSSASFASTDFSAAEGLTYLHLSGYTGTTTNIEGAKALKYLRIGIAGNNVNLGGIDASKLSDLRQIIINGSGSSYGNSVGQLILPEQSSLINLDLFMVGTSSIQNIPAQTKLTRLVFYGRSYGMSVLDLTANTDLVEIIMGRIGGGAPALNLGNKPKLRSIYNASNSGGVMSYPEVIITSAPLLKDFNGSDAYSYRSWLSKSGLEGISGRMNASVKFVLNGTAITKIVKPATAQSYQEWSAGNNEILDLKDNKISTADFSGYPKIKELHLQGNKLTTEAITALIETLPTYAAGTAKIYLNKASGETNATVTAEQTKALSDKGWVVTAP